MNNKLIAGAAGVVLLTGVGLGVPMLAQAASSTSTPSATAAAAGENTASADRHPGRGRGGSRLDAAALATKLQLSETTVSDALSAVRDQTEPRTRPSADATQAERDAAAQARQAAFVTALATELNLDEATVSTAITEIKAEHEAAEATEEKAVLDQAVTDGTLTQTEADAVQKASDAGIASIRGGGRH